MEEKQEIRNEDIFNLNFYNYGKPFTGSFQGMRYRIIKTEEKREGEEKGDENLLATVWREPFSYDAVPDEEKESRLFEFSEQGRISVVEWLNEKRKNFPISYKL